MKSNAGQLSGLPLFRDLTAERAAGKASSARTGSRKITRKDQSHLLELAAGEVLNLTKRFRAAQVQVEDGILWVTGGPDGEDVILQSGDAMELRGSSVFIAQALENATVRIWA